MRVLDRYRSFDRPVQLLLLNQLTINLGFYMLIPYLADHLSQGLGLSVLLVGVILGVRNFSQQGMFLVGGSLADRFGYKPMIVAGCALRTGGFALLGLVDNVATLVVASAATGFAGALFNPAVRAYIARDAGERRVEAFALFSVFYQAGIVVGPVVGLLLTGIDFTVTCLVAAAVFAVLTVLQIRALPARRGDADRGTDADRRPVLTQWRDVAATRGFLPFSVAMIGTYVLSYQVYLALPLHARTLAGDGELGTALVTALYVVSGGVTIAAQMKVTAWCRARWGPAASLSRGLFVLGAAFVPLLAADAVLVAFPDVAAVAATVVGIAALLATAALLAIGTAVVLPFEMDTIVGLARNRLVATHYGFYNTVCGVGILLGNAGTGWAIDLARSLGAPYAPWLVLLVIGLLCGFALALLYRRGLLTAPAEDTRAAQSEADRDPPTIRLWAVGQRDDSPTRPLPAIRAVQQPPAPTPVETTRPLADLPGAARRW
ncbi:MULTISPECIES: MFS transporter [unclassified Pseudonocardia]|jgi:MFS family permease|uniref:MDR family MFS transporter n=1 Tax=Pseudonocardia TaxID=1847 RepID=UPI0001FFDCE9|nr:MFS transporter [Pseudonocardia sp. Ae707_Ps1]OLM20037.1 putative membrane transporter [Pseudonocardia sp. Ae707_Ps1]